MEPECSLPYLQVPINSPFPEPDRLSPHTLNIPAEDPS